MSEEGEGEVKPEAEEEEEVEKHIPVILTKENIKAGLSVIGKTFDGASVAYLKLNLSEKELDGLCEELRHYKHLRYANLSMNRLAEINILAEFPYLLKVELTSNRISSLEIFNSPHTFQYLQTLDISKNLITLLTPIELPKLTHLKLMNNQISSASAFKGHPSLKVLELRANKLASLEGISDMPELEELYLAENSINSLCGLNKLPKLRKIHMRKNTISALEKEKLPDLHGLAYLNIRENEFVEVSSLGLLQKYLNLVKIVIADNPVKAEPSGDVKKECLIALPQLKFLGKEEITAEEREDAVGEAAERKRLAEEAKKEAEKAAEEAEKAAQEALLNDEAPEGSKDPAEDDEAS